MFGLTKRDSAFDQEKLEGQRATMRVMQRLKDLQKSCRAGDVSQDIGKSSLGCVAPTLSSLVECVDALQARIAELEKRGK